MSSRKWPPESREQVDHLRDCSELVGGIGPSGDRCDCGMHDYNAQAEAYWEGYDAHQAEHTPDEKDVRIFADKLFEWLADFGVPHAHDRAEMVARSFINDGWTYES